MKPRVFNKRRPHEIPAGAVYVGRPTKWGNPFIVGVHGKQGECVELFARDIESRPELVEAAKRELRGKHLVCWCAPRACHADVLLAIANS